MIKLCAYCGGSGYLRHGTDMVPCTCGSLVGSITTINPVTAILTEKMQTPIKGATQYIGQGVYQSQPAYFFSREEFEALCIAAGVPFENPGVWDSELGWMK